MSNLYQEACDREFSETRVGQITERIKADFEDRKKSNRRVAPFQFTLLMLQAMYADFLGGDYEIDSDKNKKASEVFQEKLPKDKRLQLNFQDPKSPEWALSQPVRAVEYLTWEEETRMFLARRIYPIYFDFISYSSCHEGWGAVGHMLQEIRKDPGLPYVPSIKFTQRALPFLRESQRLKFSSIWSFPVLQRPFENGPMPSSNVLGAYVVFLNDREAQPCHVLNETQLTALKKYLVGCADATKYILEQQASMLGISNDAQHASIWADTAKKHPEDVTYYEITVKVTGDRDELASKILSQIALSQQFVVVVHSDKSADSLVLLAAPSEANTDEISVTTCKARLAESIFRAVDRRVKFEIHHVH